MCVLHVVVSNDTSTPIKHYLIHNENISSPVLYHITQMKNVVSLIVNVNILSNRIFSHFQAKQPY